MYCAEAGGHGICLPIYAAGLPCVANIRAAEIGVGRGEDFAFTCLWLIEVSCFCIRAFVACGPGVELSQRQYMWTGSALYTQTYNGDLTGHDEYQICKSQRWVGFMPILIAYTYTKASCRWGLQGTEGT